MKSPARALAGILTLMLVLLTACSGSGSGAAPQVGGPESENGAVPPSSSAAEPARSESDSQQDGSSEFVIKYGSGVAEVLDKPDPDSIWAHTFKEYVEKESGGRVKVDLYFNNQLGGQTDLFQGVSSGAIEIAVLNGMTLENFNKNMCMFSMPGVFKSFDEINRVFDSEWMKQFYNQIEESDSVIITGATTTGFRNFTNSKRPLQVPSDAKGLLLRVMESPVSMRMVEALAAQPVPIDWGEVYTALQNGVADGQENALSGFIANRVYEVQKYMVLDRHMASSLMGMVSAKWLATLPEDLQKIVIDGLVKGQMAAREMMPAYYDDALKFIAEQGVEIYDPTPEELEQWHSLYRTLPHEYIRTQIQDPAYIDQLFEVIDGKRA